MQKKIIDYITNESADEPFDAIEEQEDLLGGGIIDSMGMIRLIAFLEKEFQINVPPEDMVLENFMTVERISIYLSKIQIKP